MSASKNSGKYVTPKKHATAGRARSHPYCKLSFSLVPPSSKSPISKTDVARTLAMSSASKPRDPPRVTLSEVLNVAGLQNDAASVTASQKEAAKGVVESLCTPVRNNSNKGLQEPEYELRENKEKSDGTGLDDISMITTPPQSPEFIPETPPSQQGKLQRMQLDNPAPLDDAARQQSSSSSSAMVLVDPQTEQQPQTPDKDSLMSGISRLQSTLSKERAAHSLTRFRANNLAQKLEKTEQILKETQRKLENTEEDIEKIEELEETLQNLNKQIENERQEFKKKLEGPCTDCYYLMLYKSEKEQHDFCYEDFRRVENQLEELQEKMKDLEESKNEEIARLQREQNETQKLFGNAVAKAKDWRDAHVRLNRNMNEVLRDNDEKDAQMTEIKRDNEAKHSQVKKLEGKIKSLTAQLRALRAERDDLFKDSAMFQKMQPVVFQKPKDAMLCGAAYLLVAHRSAADLDREDVFEIFQTEDFDLGKSVRANRLEMHNEHGILEFKQARDEKNNKMDAVELDPKKKVAGTIQRLPTTVEELEWLRTHVYLYMHEYEDDSSDA